MDTAEAGRIINMRTTYDIPINILIDQVKKSVDIDSFAKEMIETLLKGQSLRIMELMCERDALRKRLQEQEKEILPKRDRTRNKLCPECGTVLKGRFCHECGQAVVWE